ncbi:1-acyl-sn-glycerol-3-phosphate acyltransferase [Xanthobacter agilis]|uniref:1-acyl-sn-glycerol-3-phosphate acyltransferase n=1 Tax=Xanthobacter agilis TaxID=47492 RepID=A0ABU0L8Q0_XANAG|nr:lysophospholipid acyltransferase family protein [Xanthobacter agilis]MDQ0503518.1 1-acyl-sn-glycerol-3-phosphate acyltransferase [Xanthobacter agilis]
MVTALRSLVFQVAFYVVTVIYVFAFLPLLLLPRRRHWKYAVLAWANTNSALLRLICGTRVEIQGRENIPDGPLLIASKHQSAWETMALLPLFSDPAFVLKRELIRIPLLGWHLTKARMIPVDRSGGMAALKAMTRFARGEVEAGRQVLIFPEGTRCPPGAPPDYKFGVAHLYGSLGVPCLPVALNSGLYWPRRALTKRAGTIRVDILPPIPPGLGRAAFMARLESDIETASARLLTAGLKELGDRAPKELAEQGLPPADGSSPLSTSVENS